MWFYKIKEDSKQSFVVIIWNTSISYTILLIVIIGVIACGCNIIWLSGISLAILSGSLAYYLHKYGDLIHGLRILEKRCEIQYQGSKYSFKHPLMVQVPNYLFKRLE